jgi:hypothetical protein
VELALRYAEATAELALACDRAAAAGRAYADLSGTHVPAEVRATSDEELQRISVTFRASDIKPNILHLAFDPRSSAIAEEVERGHYDLVVVSAEDRAIQHRLFFGYENERLIRGTRIPVVVVVPNLSRLGANGHEAAPDPIGGGRGPARALRARAGADRAALAAHATAEPSDDEMRDRIARHRAERGAGFDTRVEPRALYEALAADRITTSCCGLPDALDLQLAAGGASADDVRMAGAGPLARGGRTCHRQQRGRPGLVPRRRWGGYSAILPAGAPAMARGRRALSGCDGRGAAPRSGPGRATLVAAFAS